MAHDYEKSIDSFHVVQYKLKDLLLGILFLAMGILIPYFCFREEIEEVLYYFSIHSLKGFLECILCFFGYSFEFLVFGLFSYVGLIVIVGFFINLKSFSRADTVYLKKIHKVKNKLDFSKEYEILEMIDAKGKKLQFKLTPKEKETMEQKGIILQFHEQEFYTVIRSNDTIYEIIDVSPESFEVIEEKMSKAMVVFWIWFAACFIAIPVSWIAGILWIVVERYL